MDNIEVTVEQKEVLRADGWLDPLAAKALKQQLTRAREIAMNLQATPGHETPLTDAEEFEAGEVDADCLVVSRDFAIKLEHTIAAMTAILLRGKP